MSGQRKKTKLPLIILVALLFPALNSYARTHHRITSQAEYFNTINYYGIVPISAQNTPLEERIILRLKSNPTNKANLYKLGLIYFYNANLGTLTKSVNLIKKSADQGFPPAIRQYGIILYAGGINVPQIGFTKRYKLAFNQFNKAAKLGDPIAQVLTALMYTEGLGVKKDPQKAFYWCQESAAQHSSVGEFCLGNFYSIGIGTRKNLNKAIHYYSLAAKNIKNGTFKSNLKSSYRLYEIYQNQNKNALAEQWLAYAKSLLAKRNTLFKKPISLDRVLR